MKKFIWGVVLVFAGIWLISGCASVGTLDNTRAQRPERAESLVFDYPYAKVFLAAKESCADLKLLIEEEDEREGRIFARSRLRWLWILLIQLGYGEKVGIYLTALNDHSTQVEVAVQKRLLIDMGYADWRKKILDSISNKLKE